MIGVSRSGRGVMRTVRECVGVVEDDRECLGVIEDCRGVLENDWSV